MRLVTHWQPVADMRRDVTTPVEILEGQADAAALQLLQAVLRRERGRARGREGEREKKGEREREREREGERERGRVGERERGRERVFHVQLHIPPAAAVLVVRRNEANHKSQEKSHKSQAS